MPTPAPRTKRSVLPRAVLLAIAIGGLLSGRSAPASAAAPGPVMQPPVNGPKFPTEGVTKTKPLNKHAKKLFLDKHGDFELPPTELRGKVTLSPRRPWIDARTFLSMIGDGSHRPEVGRHGRAWLSQYEPKLGLPWNYVALRFRAAARTQYLIDCTGTTHRAEIHLKANVCVAEGDARLRAPECRAGSPEISGAATWTDGHLLRLVPAKDRRRDVEAHVYSPAGPTGLERCEITPYE